MALPSEIWLSGASIGYSGYLFSSHAIAYDIKKQIVITGNVRASGYVYISLIHDDGAPRVERFHLVLARLFLGPCPQSGMTVDHLDRNPANNCIWNLRWATKSEQALNRDFPHYQQTGGRSIYQFSLDLTTYQKWQSMSFAADSLKIDKQTIYKACKTGKPYGNYYWFYAEDIEIYEDEYFIPIPGHS